MVLIAACLVSAIALPLPTIIFLVGAGGSTIIRRLCLDIDRVKRGRACRYASTVRLLVVLVLVMEVETLGRQHGDWWRRHG